MLPYQYEGVFNGILSVCVTSKHLFPQSQHTWRFMSIKIDERIVVTLRHSDEVRIVIERGMIHTGWAGVGTFRLKALL